MPALVVVALVLLGGCGSSTTHPAPAPTGFAAAVGVLPVPASAWPAAGHDARHASAVEAGVRGPRTGRQRWQRRLEGRATPGPVLGADGSVYAASNGGVLHALDPSTGADRWTFDGGGPYGSDLSTSPAVLGDGTILWPGPRRRLIALDAGGHERWSEPFGATVLSPAVAGAGQRVRHRPGRRRGGTGDRR